MIIHLNGWPGSGKKTIGEILAQKLNARFIHNHLLHDVAIACMGINNPDRWELYETVRAAAYAALTRRRPTEIFVMTNALCKNSPREQAAWRHVVDLAMTRQTPLIPIVLKLDAEENYRRIQSAERIGKKMTNAEELKSFFDIDSIQEPDVPELLILDVTELSAEQAAAEILAYADKIKNTLQPATLQYLEMR